MMMARGSQWNIVEQEIRAVLTKWVDELDMTNWQINVQYRVYDPENKGYCDVEISDIAHLKADIMFYLAPFLETGDKQHRHYLVVHELLHLVIPTANETQIARVARTLTRFERERNV